MMNEIKIFEERNVLGKDFRIYGDVDNPLFLAKDVAEWIEHSDPSRMVDSVDEDEKLLRTLFVSGQNREVLMLTEDGLYEVLMQSRKHIAKEFKKKVKEILKSIRKTGMYSVPKSFKEALLLAVAQQEKIEALQLDNSVKDQQIAEMQPKASYYDMILQCKDLISVTEIAKDYGMSAKTFNKRPHELGIQYKQSGIWFLYAKYQSRGYTKTKTQNYSKPDGTQGAKTHMYWTQKGRLFLYELLKNHGTLPMIEREDMEDFEDIAI